MNIPYEPTVVTVVAETRLASPTGAALVVDGVAAPLIEANGLLMARVEAPRTDGQPVTVTVRGADEGWLVLLDAQAGWKNERTDLLKYASRERASFRFLGGRLGKKMLPTLVGEPPALPNAAVIKHRAPGVSTFALDGILLRTLSQIRPSMLGCRAWPVRVLEDGVPLEQPKRLCADVVAGGEGLSCQTPRQIRFTPSDGSDPATNGRTYTAALDSDPACKHAHWLYPGTRVSFAVPKSGLKMLPRSANVIEIGAALPDEAELTGSIALLVIVDGAEVVQREIALADLALGPVSLPLDPPLSGSPEVVQVDVSSDPDSPYMAINSLVLSRDLKHLVDMAGPRESSK